MILNFNAFFLSGRNPKRLYTQGVALGWMLIDLCLPLVSDLWFWLLLLKKFTRHQ